MKKLLKSFMTLVAMVAIVATSSIVSVDADAAPSPIIVTTAKASIVDGNTVGYVAVVPSVPASDDGMLYLYAMPTYAYSITNECALVGQQAISANPSFKFALNHKQSTTRLYQKFALCVKQGGQVKMIANPQYIVNPEALATHTYPRVNYPKKGMQGADFGNVILSPEYEAIVNPAFLNPIVCVINNGGNQLLTNPYSRVGVKDTKPVNHDNYMFNCNDATGVALFSSKLEAYAAAASKTQDWIIGNEVNERICNYMVWVSWDEYMRQYEQEFRVAYTAIKSQNANAKVYISLDQNWDRNRTPKHSEYYSYIDVKDFLDKFAIDMKTNGDIDWGVCQHPYLVPLTYAKFWDMSGCPDGAYMKNMVATNQMVSFQNIGVLTSYLAQPAFLNPQGKLRSIILSEVGICNAQGSTVQAAALCASYVAAAQQPAVERIIYLSAQCGPFDSTFTPEAVDMYKNMDGANSAAYQQKALSVIGAANWAQVLR